MTPLAALLPILLAAAGAPPGLGLAIGSWPRERPGQGAPQAVRERVEPAIERRLPRSERGCFLYALEDLDGDGRAEILVFVEAPYWCGTGGCPLYVMKRRHRRLRIVSRTEMVRNVFLAPWPHRGWQPLYLEKWGQQFARVPARRGRYPASVDLTRTPPLATFPAGLRVASWNQAASCRQQEISGDGVRSL